jgi:hypothetical protein
MLNNSMRTGSWLLLPLLVLLAGCYDEHDVITITNGGLVHFESTVTVKDGDKKMSLEALQQAADRVVSELQQASWKVQLAWISKERPYKLTFSGEGKLAEVGRVTSFYRLYKVDDNAYTISFVTPNQDGITRSIAFKSAPDQAEVLDRKGQPVLKIASTSASDLYAIKLH